MDSSFFNQVLSTIGSAYREGRVIYNFIGTIMAILVFHRGIYVAIGLFFTRKFKPAKNKHKYAVLIPARNEENVIGNLIDSIHKQDYPKDLITIFVVADNCTDKTATIARKKGAICYERFDNEHKTKGFALQYLVKCIEKDYKVKSFDGYFVFDSDNLLKEDYISRMNDAFDEGLKIITSYRSTKNFDENWIASTYALHWLRSVRFDHRARSVLHLATNIQGTGFLFANEIIENGWNYTSITEDRALTVDAVAQGYEISYNDDAIFYDEQPTSLKIALRQRLRWSKGHILAFNETWIKLIKNMIFGKKYVKECNKTKDRRLSIRILESIRQRFASFDMFGQALPKVIINIIRWIIVSWIMYACYCYVNGINNSSLIGSSTYLGKLLNMLLGPIIINVPAGLNALFIGLIIALWWKIFYRIGLYFENILVAVYVFIVEKRRIPKIKLHKKILYCLTWPTFDIIGRYTTYIALFKKVDWKPIPHNSKITIDDINKRK